MCLSSHSHLLTIFFYFFKSKIKVIELTLLIAKMSMKNRFTFYVFSVCHSFGQSVTGTTSFIFWLLPLIFLPKSLYNCIETIKNISMIDKFTFDVFSVCHSLGQSVTGIALFICCLIPQEYSFSQKTL